MSNILKSCPICGSEPRKWVFNKGAIIECHCNDHRVSCGAKTLEDAIEAWNRRTESEE